MATTTTLKLPEALKKRIAQLAESAGKTAHAWMVEALETQASAMEKRRDFVESALLARAEVAETGRVYKSEDVHAWFLARASGRKVPKPRSYKR
ncbi:MAG: hypothetical protein FJY55_04100 [Betaproteobacteria bacterium]|nr:hypothetical protein [Betaproteobacteria bacterium]